MPAPHSRLTPDDRDRALRRLRTLRVAGVVGGVGAAAVVAGIAAVTLPGLSDSAVAAGPAAPAAGSGGGRPGIVAGPSQGDDGSGAQVDPGNAAATGVVPTDPGPSIQDAPPQQQPVAVSGGSGHR